MTTPTLAQTILDWVKKGLSETHTAMPAEIVSYSAMTGMATVQPSQKRTYPDGSLVSLPQIRNVPVCFPRAAGGAAFVHLPLAAGDPVLLVFSERSIEPWRASGGEYDPNDERMHSITDAFAIPGGYPKSMPLTGMGADDLVIGNDTTLVTIKPSGDIEFAVGMLEGKLDATGKLSFTNSMGELIALVSKMYDDIKLLFNDVATGTTPTMLGPQLLVMPTYASNLATLDADKAKLDSFKA